MNNEEKILAMLEKLTEEVGRQGDLLEKQGKLLEKHSEILEKHGEMLARHDGTLEKLVSKVDRQGELLEEIDGRSLRSAVMLENEVLPKLQLLYEGHVHLQETLAPKAQVETLEGEVVTLKSAVKMMTKRLEALEKAQ
jgi:DNA repair exonuclease SbcCD ATPase subunit